MDPVKPSGGPDPGSVGPDPGSGGPPPPGPGVPPPIGSSAPHWVVTTGVQAPAEIRRLLGSLPEWFGIESSVDEYVADAARLPTYLAWRGAVTDQPPRGQASAGSDAAPAAPGAGSDAAPGAPGAAPVAAPAAPHARPVAAPAAESAAESMASHGATARHPVGAMLVARHFPETAEIHLLAVEPGLHRSGVGRALVGALERDLIADGVRLLEVKTLGPSHPDAGFALTREFYRAMGFLPVEEITGLWPDNPCLVLIKVLTPDR
ncbi:MAG: GNAT family N-acetyltransferase [Streptosporangiaceae bacterium]